MFKADNYNSITIEVISWIFAINVRQWFNEIKQYKVKEVSHWFNSKMEKIVEVEAEVEVEVEAETQKEKENIEKWIDFD